MKVCVSVHGRFHAFELAAGLHRRGHLDALLTAGIVYKNESNRVLEMGEGRIKTKTANNADTLRGDYADLLILDEYAQMRPGLWGGRVKGFTRRHLKHTARRRAYNAAQGAAISPHEFLANFGDRTIFGIDNGPNVV